MTRILPLVFLLLIARFAPAQQKSKYTTANAHSHNDYEQAIPFYLAYNQQFGSVEADIYVRNDTLYVAHERADMRAGRTLESLYLEPLKEVFTRNNGKLFKEQNQELQLLIDLKTSWKETLPVLEKTLARYENVLSPKGPVHIVLSGNNPPAEDFVKYPAFIQFDGRPNVNYTPAQLEKVGLISQAFGAYTRWNGKGVLTKTDKQKVEEVISQVHAKGKKIRFWATPDDINAWKMMMNLGVDYLNTDKVEALGKYLRERERAEYTGPNPHEIYQPTYKNNDSRTQVDHVILLIGDGMGLTQIYAGITANRGQLNLSKFLNIGFSKTSASDSYITDSAAGATAMATGQKTRNRAIGVDSNFKAVPTLPEKIRPLGVKTALISAGDITDATPASFYAHQPYRDLQKEIAHDYLRAPVDILIGGGQNWFEHEKVADSLRLKGAQFSTKWEDLAKMKSPFVLLNDSRVVSVEKGRGEFLIPAFKKATDELKTNKAGSFIMAEGAQIDYGGHANKVSYVVTEMLDFDRLVGEALKFADSNGRTLVIVTADHETGGLTLLDGDLKRGYVDGQFSTNDHTAVMVPVFAYGPHSLDFRGVYENTEIFSRILKVFERYRK